MHKNNNANKACIDPYEKDKIQWGDILSRVVWFPTIFPAMFLFKAGLLYKYKRPKKSFGNMGGW